MTTPRKTLQGVPRPDLFHGANIIPGQNRPGQKNRGGKKGRSGRKPVDFVAWCNVIIDDPIVRDTHLTKAREGDMKSVELAAHYAVGKPSERVEHSGDVVIHVRYDD